jgi:hypothetical protein
MVPFGLNDPPPLKPLLKLTLEVGVAPCAQLDWTSFEQQPMQPCLRRTLTSLHYPRSCARQLWSLVPTLDGQRSSALRCPAFWPHCVSGLETCRAHTRQSPARALRHLACWSHCHHMPALLRRWLRSFDELRLHVNLVPPHTSRSHLLVLLFRLRTSSDGARILT